MRFLCLALVLAGTTVAIPAMAETEQDRKEAGKLFMEGQRAFTTGDFRHSAESFEEAYRKVPKLPALWNAARAWHRAGEPVRAANLYASYPRQGAPKAPDRASAIKSMKELEAKLGRLEVHAEGFDSVTVDAAPIDGTRLYVTPGSHLVEGRERHEGRARNAECAGGERRRASCSSCPRTHRRHRRRSPWPNPSREKVCRWSSLRSAVCSPVSVRAS